jgi:hypothetical protein
MVWIGWLSLCLATPLLAGDISFNRDIRPILSENCFHCHGPAKEGRKAKLRLDLADAAYAERDGVRAIVPGNLDASEAVHRIRSIDPDEQMPPPDSHYKLTKKQIGLLESWIKSGAAYEGHWAFIAPQTSRDDPIRMSIDRAVRARVKTAGLRTSSQADKATLIRRLSLDLRGLPPSLAEVDAFLADSSPTAWADLVDRYLASAECAERLALDWLDAARYADTNGYSIDDHRDMWVWRDWVINAFLTNMPYDQFMMEQLAGDLMPNATTEQKMATGFLRNSMNTHEGGTIAEEYRVAYVVDKVDTVATTFLGLTMKCAQCHDHKYDPISQKDYYSFFAFFNTSSEPGSGGQNGNTKPMMQARSPLHASVDFKARLTRRIDEFKYHRVHPELRFPDVYATWVAAQLKTSDDAAPPPVALNKPFVLPDGAARPEWIWIKQDAVPAHILIRRSFTLRAAPTSARLFFTCDDNARLYVNGKHIGAIEHWKSPLTLDVASQLVQGENVISVDAHNTGGVAAFLAALEVRHAEGANEIIVSDTNWLARVATTEADANTALRTSGVDFAAADVIGRHGDGPWGSLFGPDNAPTIAFSRAMLRKAPESRSPAEHASIADAFATYHPVLKKFNKAIDGEIDILQKQHDAGMSSVMIMDQTAPATAPMLARGQYDQKGEVVAAAVPSVLGDLPEGRPGDRLALAQWLASASHPLTARVAVNRFWQLVFGVGIVRTAEDFGSQGEWPSHPELLDTLAVEFKRDGWNVRALLKEMVMSETYQQMSKISASMLEQDPYNRLLARAPRTRLPAELVRDNAMAISGLLNPVVGGPSAFPNQPEGLWRQVSHFGHGGFFSAQAYFDSVSADRYRRSMYTAWKRTAPPPAMAMFDAPTRETCTVRRMKTNTPLQALVLMNDPQFVDAARALAQRMMAEGGAEIKSRIRHAFRLATARMPTAKETAVLVRGFERERQRFAKNPAAAVALMSKHDGPEAPLDLAAYTMVASTILNLDETITKQ